MYICTVLTVYCAYVSCYSFIIINYSIPWTLHFGDEDTKHGCKASRVPLPNSMEHMTIGIHAPSTLINILFVVNDIADAGMKLSSCGSGMYED